ncbi:MAG TPA: FxsB family cyclophane-forming radical SAM/SPASM peptide maturase [Streptosporangiaceae bacterium]
MSGQFLPPFREFVLKIHSRCNLACDYCYMYSLADQRWRTRPAVMPDDVIDQAAARISEHARRWRLPVIRAILHGGEPLLAGPAVIGRVAARLRAAAGAPTSVLISAQTNGSRLTAANLRMLDSLGIGVAVSLDGGAPEYNRHRRRRDGLASYPEVRDGLLLLASERYRHLFRGILSVVDIQQDPLAVYSSLLRFGPPAIDFLLPHANWSAPPRRAAGAAARSYAGWLITIFDDWYGRPRREVRIRLFEEYMQVLLGGTSRAEGVGLAQAPVAVIETDGGIEQPDSLKSAYDGATALGMHVRTHSLDQALGTPSAAARHGGAAALAPACQACALRTACGGGLYAHRYRAGHGFGNPSVYCADLGALISHIRGRLAADLAGKGRPAAGDTPAASAEPANR